MNCLATRIGAALTTVLLTVLAVVTIVGAGNRGSLAAGQPESLYAGVPSYQDCYADAIATDGSSVIVGAPRARVGGGHRGAAYAFSSTGSTWSPIPLQPAVDLTKGDLYGAAVAVDGPVAVVGAPGTAHGRGAAYVFLRSEVDWVPEAVLTAPSERSFGAAVAVSGETIVVGAPDAGAGAVFVYTRSTEANITDDADLDYGWVAQRLVSPSGTDGGAFGTAVAIDDDVIAVGAPNESAGAGTVTVFEKRGSEWSPTTIPALPGLTSLGSSVDLDLPHLVAGAPESPVVRGDDTIAATGRVLVWTRSVNGDWSDPSSP